MLVGLDVARCAPTREVMHVKMRFPETKSSALTVEKISSGRVNGFSGAVLFLSVEDRGVDPPDLADFPSRTARRPT
jgi:hypothetical protein